MPKFFCLVFLFILLKPTLACNSHPEAHTVNIERHMLIITHIHMNRIIGQLEEITGKEEREGDVVGRVQSMGILSMCSVRRTKFRNLDLSEIKFIVH